MRAFLWRFFILKDRNQEARHERGHQVTDIGISNKSTDGISGAPTETVDKETEMVSDHDSTTI